MAKNLAWDLDAPLLQLSATDAFTLRDAVAGVHCFGATGGGKTSGTGAALARAYLRAGMGGLVLCAKPEEISTWQRYAAENGRSNSVILFDETQGLNFLAYELARQGTDGIGSVVECLMQILEAARRASPQPGGASDSFWLDSVRQLLYYTIPPLYVANGTVSIGDILDFVHAAPTSGAQYDDREGIRDNLVYDTLQRAKDAPKVPIDPDSLDRIIRYWFNQYTAIPEKTRGNIIASLSTTLDRFNHGRLKRAFCGRTTLVPDMCFNGIIVIMAMPALTWGMDGIIAQQLFKFLWQRTVLARNALPEQFRERPVFLFADEAHHFVNSYDAEFMSTCRAVRACTVFMSQNLPGYFAKMGKQEEVAAESLIGQFNTHAFHLNADTRTNEFSSKLIGRSVQMRSNYNKGYGTNRNAGMNTGNSSNFGSSASSGFSSGSGGGSSSSNHGTSSGTGDSYGDNRGLGNSENTSRGYSEVMDNIIEPAWFSTGLLSGGPANGNLVTALWFKNGGRFQANGGRPFLHVTFQQGRP